MALDDDAVVLPGTGYVFLNNTPGAAPPGDTVAEIAALNLEAATLPTGWTNTGHTSRENNVSLGKEGGDITAVGTWQAAALRTRQDPIVWSITVNALQVSNDVFQMYFGGGDFSDPGRFDIPDNPTPVDRGLFLVMVDGPTRLPIHVPKVSVTGGDATEVDPENFLEFQLVCTWTKLAGNPLASFFHENLGTPA